MLSAEAECHRSNRCPVAKGTEMEASVSATCAEGPEVIDAPSRRGLKSKNMVFAIRFGSRSNRCPVAKGTEIYKVKIKHGGAGAK